MSERENTLELSGHLEIIDANLPPGCPPLVWLDMHDLAFPIMEAFGHTGDKNHDYGQVRITIVFEKWPE